jgi:hypothetical protein
MANITRRQLTLFAGQENTAGIEQVRQAYNPAQFNLIKAHVTLCREDEIEKPEQVINNISFSSPGEIEIEFGEITRFSDGTGILLPGVGDNTAFKALRRLVLAGTSDLQKQEPHITLMHPGNSTCSEAIFAQISSIHLPKKIKFNCISLIEQTDGGAWKILQQFDLK